MIDYLLLVIEAFIRWEMEAVDCELHKVFLSFEPTVSFYAVDSTDYIC